MNAENATAYFVLFTIGGKSLLLRCLASNRDDAVTRLESSTTILKKNFKESLEGQLFEVVKGETSFVWRENAWVPPTKGDFRLTNALLGFGP